LNTGATPPFSGSGLVIDAVTDATVAVGLSDFNGDNKLDLVVVNENEPIRLYLNNGSAATPQANPFTLAAAVGDATGSPASSLAVGDLDGDGAPDIVVGNHAGKTHLYLNRRNATPPPASPFAGATPILVGSATDVTTAVALGDLNGDGDADLLVGRDGQTNQVYLNNGTVDPFAGVSAVDLDASTQATRALALADVNGDSKLDVIVGYAGAASAVYLNNGTA